MKGLGLLMHRRRRCGRMRSRSACRRKRCVAGRRLFKVAIQSVGPQRIHHFVRRRRKDKPPVNPNPYKEPAGKTPRFPPLDEPPK